MAPGSRARTHVSSILASLCLVIGMVAVGGAPAMADAPAISSFTPTSGGVGVAVTITGTGFVSVTAVEFAGVAATFTVPSATSIETSVPALASTGPISVTASGVTTASVTDFTVTRGLMLSPIFGPPTTRITLSGSVFETGERVDLSFDGTKLEHVVADANGNFTRATLRVPASAKPGTHSVSVRGRSSGERAHSSFLVRTDWSQFRNGVDHWGLNPYENVLSVSSVGRLVKDWSYATGGPVDSSPAVVDGVVYVGSNDDKVYALAAAAGTLLWSCATGGDVHSSPAVVDGAVYVGSLDNSVYALDASKGALLWRYTTGDWVGSSPAVANVVVYIGSGDHNVYALDASTGALRWSFTTGDWVWSSPAVARGVVYVWPWDEKVYALKASTGTLLWSLGLGDDVDSSPAVANGVIYAGSGDGQIHAVDASAGAPLWSHMTVNWDVDSNGVVYIGSTNGKVYALRTSTGAVLWTHRTGDGILSSPAVANGVVFAGSGDGNVYAFGLAGGH